MTVSLVLATGVIVRKERFEETARNVAAFFFHDPGRPGKSSSDGDKRLSIEKALSKRLLELECRAPDIKSRYSAGDRAILMQASVPRGRPFEWAVLVLSQAAQGTPYVVSDCVVDEKKQSARITFSPSASAAPAKNSPAVMLTVTGSERYYSGTARMALVLENCEDTSYQLAVSLLSFAEPLTVSVVPGSKKAALIAQLADQHRKEVIIRLPFETQGRVPSSLENPAIMVHYSRDAIRGALSDAIKDIPNFTGFANAWGSRACEDSRVMNIVLADIRKQHGYFMETRTTKNSVVASVASEVGCPFSQVTALIDKKTVPDILAELKRLGAGAQASGSLAACARASRQLCDALNEARPWFRANGIRLVFVSEIVTHPHE